MINNKIMLAFVVTVIMSLAFNLTMIIKYVPVQNENVKTIQLLMNGWYYNNEVLLKHIEICDIIKDTQRLKAERLKIITPDKEEQEYDTVCARCGKPINKLTAWSTGNVFGVGPTHYYCGFDCMEGMPPR